MSRAEGSLSGLGSLDRFTLHRLKVFDTLGVSFKTTNLIESVMARLEAKTRRVTRWRTSDQKLRWRAAALWATERQFRRIKHHRYLPLLSRRCNAHSRAQHPPRRKPLHSGSTCISTTRGTLPSAPTSACKREPAPSGAVKPVAYRLSRSQIGAETEDMAIRSTDLH